jgi:hypothetical protein
MDGEGGRHLIKWFCMARRQQRRMPLPPQSNGGSSQVMSLSQGGPSLPHVT